MRRAGTFNFLPFFIAPEIKRLERPLTSRRRHSDSSLFCKARDQNIEESEKEEERFLGEEKYEFVQRYLENVRDVHSATTETSDSGVKTHGAPSELEMEVISGNYHHLLLNQSYLVFVIVLLFPESTLNLQCLSTQVYKWVLLNP